MIPKEIKDYRGEIAILDEIGKAVKVKGKKGRKATFKISKRFNREIGKEAINVKKILMSKEMKKSWSNVLSNKKHWNNNDPQMYEYITKEEIINTYESPDKGSHLE